MSHFIQVSSPDLNAKNILVVVTSVDYILLANGKKHPTGQFLSEMMVPVKAFRERGWNIKYTNATGVKPVIDPFSDHKVWFGIT